MDREGLHSSVSSVLHLTWCSSNVLSGWKSSRQRGGGGAFGGVRIRRPRKKRILNTYYTLSVPAITMSE